MTFKTSILKKLKFKNTTVLKQINLINRMKDGNLILSAKHGIQQLSSTFKSLNLNQLLSFDSLSTLIFFKNYLAYMNNNR
jgi:hypothetical protein